MKNILVAVDLDANSTILVDKAAELAQKFGSKVWILHISDPEPDFVGNRVGPKYIREIRAKEIRSEHRQIRDYNDQLKNKGIEAEGLLVAGATAETILQEIKKLQADLVIIGHYHHSFLYKLFAGNTDFTIVEKAKVPVLIIPVKNSNS